MAVMLLKQMEGLGLVGPLAEAVACESLEKEKMNLLKLLNYQPTLILELKKLVISKFIF